MSLAITHFFFGASVVLAVFTSSLIFGWRPRWWILAVVISGVWAMGPDICQVTPLECSQAHVPGWMNLFWFHGFLDATDTTDAPLAACTVIFLFVVLLVSDYLVRVGLDV